MVHDLALGIFNNNNYPTEMWSLILGDIMKLYADGKVKTNDQVGVEFGIERLAAAINQGRDLPAVELIHMIIQTTQ